MGYEVVGPTIRQEAIVHDRVTKVKLPKAFSTDSDTDRPFYEYHYNTIGAVDYVDAPPTTLTAVVSTGYARTSYAYNFRGQVTDVWLPDPATGAYDSGSPRYQYQYDAAGRLTKTIDPLGNETRFAYDSTNRLIGKTLAKPTGTGAGLADNPDPTSTEANSPRYKYFYDDADNLIKVVDPLGAETRFAYDVLGRVVTMTEANATSGAAADPTTSTPGNATSPTTAYEYYAGNQLKKVTNPLAAETRYHFDALGRLDGMTLANPATTGSGAGLADDPDPASTATVTPRYKYGYDKNSNLTSVTDPMAHVTSFGFDHRDRQYLVRQPNPTGGGSSGGPQTTMVYDGVGNVVEVITPPNTASTTQFNHTAYLYDGRNQLIEIDEPGSGGSATGPETHFEYDKAGNRTKVTDPLGVATTSDAFDHATDFVFDALNRLKTDTNYNGTTGYARTYTYDKNNNLTNLVDRNGRHTLYGYDKLNRLTSEVWYANATTTQVDYLVNYGYDLAGNLTSGAAYSYSGGVLDTSKNIGDVFYRDKLGQAYNQFHLGPYDLPDTKLINSFDTAGNQTSTQAQFNSGSGYATDNTIDRTFDTLSRLDSIKQTGSGFGGSGVSSKLVTVAYNKLSQVLDVHRYAASTASSSAEVAQTYNYYDGQNRVYIIQHKPSISGTAQTQTLLKYDYFADSSLKKEKTEGLAAGGGGSSWYLWDGLHEYAYDPRGQLTGDTHTPYTVSGSSSTAGTTQNNTYGYDASGNRDSTYVAGATTNYGTSTAHAGPNNELTTVGPGTGGSGGDSYTYDHEGNVTRIDHADTSYTTYAWDNRNRLVSVKEYSAASGHPLTNQVDYLYDAFDRRSVRTVTPTGGTATSEHFVYDGLSDNVLYTFSDADGPGTSSAPALSKRYLTALDQIFAQENIGASGTDVVNWLLVDRLGSTRVLLYNDGALKQTVDYDPYGNATVRNSSATIIGRDQAATPFQFTGQFYDAAIKLQNNLNRWYDPQSGRWYSNDPIGFTAGDFHQGRYLFNSPTNGTDPSGLFSLDQLTRAKELAQGDCATIGNLSCSWQVGVRCSVRRSCAGGGRDLAGDRRDGAAEDRAVRGALQSSDRPATPGRHLSVVKHRGHRRMCGDQRRR